MVDKVGNITDNPTGRQVERQTGISSASSNCLKGIFAICVLIHHLYQGSGLLHDTVIGGVLQAFGYLSVACFFFLSGYGLYASYQIKGRYYIKTFCRKKIIPFYEVMCLFIAIYFLANTIYGQNISIWVLIKYLTFGGTIIGNGWYLQVQLVLYLLFYITFRYAKEDRAIPCIIGECMSMCIILYLCGFESTWYEGIMAFPLGMVWCRYQDKLNFLKKGRITFSVAITAFMFVCTCFGLSRILPNEIISVICKSMSAVIFPIVVVVIVSWISIENNVTCILGRYSMEIYILQGLFLSMFHQSPINIENPYMYVLMVMIFVGIGTVITHPITSRIYSSARRK